MLSLMPGWGTLHSRIGNADGKVTTLFSPWAMNAKNDGIISELLNAEQLREKGKRTGMKEDVEEKEAGEEKNRGRQEVELEHRDENSRTEAQLPLQHRARE